jgi:hypothetical protein
MQRTYYAETVTQQQNPTFVTGTTAAPVTTIHQAPIEQGQWIQGYKGYMHPVVVTIINFFLPGLGDLLIKQTEKGIALFVGFYITLVLLIALCFIIIGFFLLPFMVFLWIIIMVDGWECASKLKKGFPIMKGECTNIVTAWYANKFKSGPVFVTSKPETWPPEYAAAFTTMSHA